MALPEQWTRYKQQFLDNISDGFIAFDRHWKVTSANTKGCLLLNSRRDELLGKSVYDRHWKFYETTFYKHMRKAVESRREVIFSEYSQRFRKRFEVKALPTDEGVYALFREAADGEFELVEQQYYHALFLQHSDAVYAMDLSGHLISVNPAMERLTAYARQGRRPFYHFAKTGT